MIFMLLSYVLASLLCHRTVRFGLFSDAELNFLFYFKLSPIAIKKVIEHVFCSLGSRSLQNVEVQLSVRHVLQSSSVQFRLACWDRTNNWLDLLKEIYLVSKRMANKMATSSFLPPVLTYRVFMPLVERVDKNHVVYFWVDEWKSLGQLVPKEASLLVGS